MAASGGGGSANPHQECRAADAQDVRCAAPGGHGRATSAAILGRAAELDYGRGFDHARGGIESLLQKRATRGHRDQGHGKGAMPDRCVVSPPLTDDEIADIREFFAGDWVEEAARRREYVKTIVEEDGSGTAHLENRL